MAVGEVNIRGLREFRAQLRAMDRGLPKALRKAGNEAASIVVDAARPRVPIGPGIGGHAASSIKAASTQSATRVSEGGGRFPYMPWLDFGGQINKHTGRPTTRPYIGRGRFIWAAFGDHRDEVMDRLLGALDQVARDAGIETT